MIFKITNMLFIKNSKGIYKSFKSSPICDAYNYKIYKLLDYEIFYIINIKNYNLAGFILNSETSVEDKAYYYYNIYKHKVFYLNNMKIDNIHHSDTKDMICTTKEVLCSKKIEYIEDLLV